MIKNVVKATANAKKQAIWWKYLAWTSPFVALAIIVGEVLLGFDNLVQSTSLIILITFIGTSVLWWWWAISKIALIVESIGLNADRFNDIINDLKETRKLVQDLDADTRKWREPKSDKPKSN